MLRFLVAFAGLVCPQDGPSAPRIELPRGPAAEVAASLDPGVMPAPLPRVEDDPWSRPATWKRWAEILERVSRAGQPEPGAEAELAQLALAQGRYEDAWERFAACAGAPEIAAGLLPLLIPGARAGPIEEGAVLRPALPPPSGPEARAAGALRGGVDRRVMSIEGMRVGSAVLAMKISVEVEGVQIDVVHRSGGPVKLSIAIPRDTRFGFSDEYVDWYRAEVKGVPHELAIAPGDDEHTLYARFEPRAPEWPTQIPESVPAQIRSGGLRIDPGDSRADLALFAAIAESFASGPLRLPATVRASGGGEGSFTGITLDLSDLSLRARKLAWIVGAVEQRSLGSR
jgi:hypothetical protein